MNLIISAENQNHNSFVFKISYVSVQECCSSHTSSKVQSYNMQSESDTKHTGRSLFDRDIYQRQTHLWSISPSQHPIIFICRPQEFVKCHVSNVVVCLLAQKHLYSQCYRTYLTYVLHNMPDVVALQIQHVHQHVYIQPVSLRL